MEKFVFTKEKFAEIESLALTYGSLKHPRGGNADADVARWFMNNAHLFDGDVAFESSHKYLCLRVFSHTYKRGYRWDYEWLLFNPERGDRWDENGFVIGGHRYQNIYAVVED